MVTENHDTMSVRFKEQNGLRKILGTKEREKV